MNYKTFEILEYAVLLLLIILVIFSCCSTKPVIITQKECNEKAISNYIQECIPKNITKKEFDYYFNECNTQAKQKYCNEKRFLIVKGEQIPCDSVEEKYKELCK